MNTVLMTLLVSPLVYLAIALLLVAIPFNKRLTNEQSNGEGESPGLNFESLGGVSTPIPETAFSQDSYVARDGAELVYRWFQGRVGSIRRLY